MSIETRLKSGEQIAFPYEGDAQTGLTKREYFAALVLQGLIAKEGHSEGYEWQDTARAVRYADLLLEELSK